MAHNHSNLDTSRDTAPRDETSLSNLAVGASDIEELLYGGELTTGERLAELGAMRSDLQLQDTQGASNPEIRALLISIDDAIAELEASAANDPSVEEAEPLDPLLPVSPDDELRMTVEEDIEGELSDDDDETEVVSEWDAENDGHDGRSGYH